jgi:predicted nucleotidyltransferase
MPLPEFNHRGDLPEGVHRATRDEVIARFGHGAPQRQLVTGRLKRIYELARATGKLERFVIFGSYITAKAAPNDVDIILVMREGFDPADCNDQEAVVFDHLRTHVEVIEGEPK